VAIFDPAIFDGQVSKLFDTPAATTTGGGGRFYRHYSRHYPYEEKRKKLTKKDEKELKRLLINVAEEEKRAKQKLEAKVRELHEEMKLITDIQEIISEVEKYFIRQKNLDKITSEELIKRMEIIQEEETIMLLLAL